MTQSRAARSPTARRAPALTERSLDDLLDGAAPGDLDALASALLADPAVASGDVRARLLASLETTHRFDDLEAVVADLLDLSVPAAGALLLDVDRAAPWEAGPHEHCKLFHVRGGPRVQDAVTGFVRIEPGSGFPEHEHLGDEAVLVLQGAFREADGHVVKAGEIARMPAGTSHAFEAAGDLPLIYLAVIQRGVVIGGAKILPGDPRA